MKRKILDRFGAVAIFYENYILPWTSLVIIYGIAAEAYINREQTLLLLQNFLSGGLPPSQTSLLLRIPFLIALLTYNLTLACGLLIRKKAPHDFESFQEILLPFAACFYFYILNLSVFLPPEMSINLMPVFLQRFFMLFGVTLMVMGFLIAAIGIFDLGNSFAIFVEARGLVTRGLYRFSRHPVYFGHFLRTVGMCLATSYLFHVTINVLMIYLLVQRALLEEKKLLSHYPEYQTYLEKTPSFFLMLFGKDRHALLKPTAIIPKKMSTRKKVGWAVFLLLSFAIGYFAVTYGKGKAGVAASQDGVPISFTVYGQGDPTLVFVHGWGGDRSFWEKQIPYFRKKYRVVTLDLAGRGRSGRKRTVYSMRSFGEDVAAVVRKLQASKVILIGHSSGGPVIVETAAIIPDRVTALIGVDALQDLETTYTPAQIRWVEAPFRTDYKKAMRSFVQSLCLSGADSSFVDDVTERMLRTPVDVGVSSMDELLKTSYITHPPKITAPVWCLNSDLLRTRAKNNRKYIPEINVRVIPGVGHFMMLENHEEFNLQLDALLEEIKKTR
ncbi:MAG: alpha/beta fold hydrolase [Candidatus Omnitrophota bacterium]